MTEETPRETLKSLLQKRQLYVSVDIDATRALFDTTWGTRFEAPKSLALECLDDRCVAIMVWDHAGETKLQSVPKSVKFFSLFYRCRHCRSSWVQFEVATESVSETSMRVTVHGIYPEQFPGVSRAMLTSLGESQAVLYLRAIQSRAAGMGLGSLAYLRRVVEDAIDILLESLANVLSDSEDPKHLEYVAQVGWLKSQKAFDKKAVAAAAVLPKSFFAGGHNPFARLHEWASVGVHNEPDEECCEIFDEIRGLFEALFERLETERETRRLYADRLGKISKRIPPKALTGPSS